MAHNRIFISYSHEDQSYLDEFRSYLKFWEDKGLLDIWSDSKLQAGQDWHKEIQQAIDSAGIGVLLISQDFLNSSYIREHELEPLLHARAQEKTALTCLYLCPSVVDDSDCVFPGGRGNEVRLTQYQGLNAPDKPVSSCQGDERARLYLRAVRQLRDLARQMGIEAEPVSRPSGERQQELTICLQVRGNRFYALYSLPSEPLFAQDYLDCGSARSAAAEWLANGALPREAESLGSALFTLLFGPAEKGFCNRIIESVRTGYSKRG